MQVCAMCDRCSMYEADSRSERAVRPAMHFSRSAKLRHLRSEPLPPTPPATSASLRRRQVATC